MIQSMTGYGQVMASTESDVSVEIKSLNSKFIDLSLRLPKKFAEKENEVRNLITEKLQRGKISITIESQSKEERVGQQYDEKLFLASYSELKKLADKVMGGYDSLFQVALDSPGVRLSTSEEAINPAEWDAVFSSIKKAVAICVKFREEEGKALDKELRLYIGKIHNGLNQVADLDTLRIDRIREKLKGSISSFFGNEGYDKNRLEQEMIFYIEKLDIQEERVRLKTHLEYFLAVLNEPESRGKKLGFIAQEIGREINTIGSKANDAAIQKTVVEMKDELEKIKEQLNNVL
ncbi:MAG: UPF0701 protein YicC [Cytophagales bacterium]|jgi:uncharacterized protein (TIGR00255 family)|nr:YicC family protein [Bacteroidota bacterium]MBS1982129.1 YicC family protein [Bacteroidota bacterium]WHZ06397.1 MAG: UPF0701 protein YicC [Cytophagales bacterium]